jgi:DNA-directed RNA polymerase omega subunit
MSVETKAPESQFAYVVVASRRARQLMAGAPPLIDNPRTMKPTRIAADELDMGLLEFERPEKKTGEEDKDGKRRK